MKKIGYYGVKIESKKDCPIQNLTIQNCHTENIGGSAMQMGQTSNVQIKNNLLHKSGSYIDERMHGRGSGSWTFQCHKILCEGNTFMDAKGKMDSCSVHIDYGNTNVVI